ncbi:hypothetical protein BBP40_011282 [Aspergillus hancockii]|nr:hypothetical protein BBP40_011282 [Aspergillus hancockii]
MLQLPVNAIQNSSWLRYGLPLDSARLYGQVRPTNIANAGQGLLPVGARVTWANAAQLRFVSGPWSIIAGDLGGENNLLFESDPLTGYARGILLLSWFPAPSILKGETSNLPRELKSVGLYNASCARGCTAALSRTFQVVVMANCPPDDQPTNATLDGSTLMPDAYTSSLLVNHGVDFGQTRRLITEVFESPEAGRSGMIHPDVGRVNGVGPVLGQPPAIQEPEDDITELATS